MEALTKRVKWAIHTPRLSHRATRPLSKKQQRPQSLVVTNIHNRTQIINKP